MEARQVTVRSIEVLAIAIRLNRLFLVPRHGWEDRQLLVKSQKHRRGLSIILTLILCIDW
jgi:hypothetical protein